MEEDKVTAKQVYDKIKKLKKEFKELGDAIVVVEEKRGKESKAYEILSGIQKKKYEEIDSQEKQLLTL